MTSVRRRWLVLVGGLSLLVLSSGCSTTGSGGSAAQSQVANGAPVFSLSKAEESAIALDLVSVLVQLPESAPFYTTIQYAEPAVSFGHQLIDTLSATGYGLQRVDYDQGANYLSYSLRSVQLSGEWQLAVSVTINQLALTREYHRRGQTLYPADVFRVSGTTPRRIILNTNLFPSRARATWIRSGVGFLNDDGTFSARYSALRPTTVRSGQTRDTASVDTLRQQIVARAAFYTADRLAAANNTRQARTRYRPHRLLKIRFSGETLTLGPSNKSAIRQLLDDYREQRDRLVITGCSHGKSLLWDGTEALSLARSLRVRDELLLYGIAPARVRESGCFSTDYAERLTHDAVIIALEKPATTAL